MKLTGMWKDALDGLIKKPVTQRYPFVRLDAPERLRGQLHWDSTNCTGCQLCSKDCPADAIELITIDKKAKQFVFRYHVDRCTFCAQCVESCNKGCLSMANDEWELAALSREPMVLTFGDEEHVAAVLAGRSDPDAEPTGSE
ncbi:MAG TPA: 4Fe-4S dicluster domain-containing protein [Aggregatilinea sp.]|uniref:4Fe-4S dicluster domain-containing protein n=1 Tax=Aggregatilinea sp. TaxID=2806333 RepID=UPI002B82D206|nr:4Fe-4S dicluster domain-containing protein [Aggregatilinea sp.]HML24512.1 4Fe-4S dicluster domain-containing protein [Aggregatilinea sp.]